MPRTLSVASAIFACLVATPLVHADTFTFQTLDNPGDPAFNQSPGINDAGTIAGYFGDGMICAKQRLHTCASILTWLLYK